MNAAPTRLCQFHGVELVEASVPRARRRRLPDGTDSGVTVLRVCQVCAPDRVVVTLEEHQRRSGK